MRNGVVTNTGCANDEEVALLKATVEAMMGHMSAVQGKVNNLLRRHKYSDNFEFHLRETIKFVANARLAMIHLGEQVGIDGYNHFSHEEELAEYNNESSYSKVVK